MFSAESASVAKITPNMHQLQLNKDDFSWRNDSKRLSQIVFQGYSSVRDNDLIKTQIKLNDLSNQERVGGYQQCLAIAQRNRQFLEMGQAQKISSKSVLHSYVKTNDSRKLSSVPRLPNKNVEYKRISKKQLEEHGKLGVLGLAATSTLANAELNTQHREQQMFNFNKYEQTNSKIFNSSPSSNQKLPPLESMARATMFEKKKSSMPNLERHSFKDTSANWFNRISQPSFDKNLYQIKCNDERSIQRLQAAEKTFRENTQQSINELHRKVSIREQNFSKYDFHEGGIRTFNPQLNLHSAAAASNSHIPTLKQKRHYHAVPPPSEDKVQHDHQMSIAATCQPGVSDLVIHKNVRLIN